MDLCGCMGVLLVIFTNVTGAVVCVFGISMIITMNDMKEILEMTLEFHFCNACNHCVLIPLFRQEDETEIFDRCKGCCRGIFTPCYVL